MTQTDDADALYAAALAAMAHAHAPYSRFRVGAALRSATGEVSVGCNVENAAYPAGICAERSALAAGVAAGHRQFAQLVVVSDAATPTPPCGLCRQALVEFSPDLEVVSATTSGKRSRWTLRELIPQPFSPASLARA